MSDQANVWIGLKTCGCCVAVVIEHERIPKKETERCKRHMLRDGLSVVRVSMEQWRDKYIHGFMECAHDEPAPAQAS